MITDDRLKELLTVGGANSAPMHEISEMAELILSLRSQKKALIEIGNEMRDEADLQDAFTDVESSVILSKWDILLKDLE